MGGGPDIPDPNEAAIAGTVADLQNFPFQYTIDAVAKMGGKWTDPATGKTYDFTGLGDADNAAIISDQMAQALLDIQKNYGADYVRQRIENLKQADPKGYAARKELFDRIMADANRRPDRPLSNELQGLITQTLEKGGRLDQRATQQVQEKVRGGQVGRGLYLGNAAAQQETGALVDASDQVRSQRQQQGVNFLEAGVSPEDVEYRRIQQALANLGAFVNNQTPEAQFGQLSGAQAGAAPFTSTGTPNARTNPNAAAEGISFAYGSYNNLSQQANPWLASASTGINTLGTMASLGWSPWNTGNTIKPDSSMWL